MKKLIPLLITLSIAACQPDEVIIVRGRPQIVVKDQGKTYEVSDQGKDCPPCQGNTYCNRATGKCEGVAIEKKDLKEIKKGSRDDYNLNGKPISVDRLVWMDKGGPDRSRLID